MKTVVYTLEGKSKLSANDIKIIENASENDGVCDEECPELSLEQLKSAKMAYPKLFENQIYTVSVPSGIVEKLNKIGVNISDYLQSSINSLVSSIV